MPRKPKGMSPEDVKEKADRAEGLKPESEKEFKHPGGRPPKYQGGFAKSAEKLCKLGATDDDLADFFEVNVRTIARWKVEHEEFCQALKAGKDEADDRVEQSLYRRAVGYSHDAVKIMQHQGEVVKAEYREHFPPDTTACIFWLKNRRPEEWRDKVVNEHTGKDGGPIQTEEVSARDILSRRISGLAARGTEEGSSRKPH